MEINKIRLIETTDEGDVFTLGHFQTTLKNEDTARQELARLYDLWMDAALDDGYTENFAHFVGENSTDFVEVEPDFHTIDVMEFQ